MDAKVKMGPMIREKDAVRVEEWVREAVGAGARLVTGGERRGAIYAPTVVADVKPEMRISSEELFGPAVAVTPFDDIDQAIALANDTNYGLSAAIFTESLEHAMKFAREVHSGNLHVNWGPQWRADLMPYGGLKESGFGKEGPRYAVEEMTELKLVVLHLRSCTPTRSDRSAPPPAHSGGGAIFGRSTSPYPGARRKELRGPL